MAKEKEKQNPSLLRYLIRDAGIGAAAGGVLGAGAGAYGTADLLDRARHLPSGEAHKIYANMSDDVNASWLNTRAGNAALGVLPGLDAHEQHYLQNMGSGGAKGAAAGAAMGALVALARYYKDTRTK